MTAKKKTSMLIRAGVIAGSLSAIGGVVLGGIAFARPYLASDPPPLAGQQRVMELAQNFMKSQKAIDSMYQNQLFLTQQFWIKSQADAEQALRINPNNLQARQEQIAARNALLEIQQQLYGKK